MQGFRQGESTRTARSSHGLRAAAGREGLIGKEWLEG